MLDVPAFAAIRRGKQGSSSPGSSAASPHRPRAAGWTLIETVAVLAIIAILAAVLVPSAIKRVDRAAWTKETADLNAIADAFTQSIIRNKTIPNHNGWASAVASQMSLPVSAITANARRNNRAFLIYQDLDINGPLPYTQSANGASKPSNARIMIVSSLDPSNPLQIASGLTNPSEFDDIWNTPENTKPSTWTGWTGSGDDLRIKKINLEPLFHQVILINHDETVGKFAIDSSSITNVPSGLPGRLGWNKYYLDSTVVNLHGTDDALQTRHLLQRNISFVFESGQWRGQIEGGLTTTIDPDATDFLNHATSFYNAGWNTQAQQGASQISVLVAMYTFMFDYVFWATQCPHFNDHTNSGAPSSLPEYKMLNDTGQNNAGIDKFSKDLLN
jgi:type II secretory pathway pseudopilin PulG